MTIEFQFDLARAIQATAYILHSLGGSTQKVKLTKLLYIVDRDHFLSHGYPVTGDRQYAMKHGPVPSACLDALDGELREQHDQDSFFSHIQVINTDILLRQLPDGDLAQSERAVIDRVLAAHGKKYHWSLVDETHNYPEYVETYVPGTSTRIPYETILRHHAKGDPSKWRMNRPVISPEMAARMVCPFPVSEPDL